MDGPIAVCAAMLRNALDRNAVNSAGSHFTGRHREFAMFYPSIAGHMTADRHIVRWVREHHLSLLTIHEPRDSSLVGGVSTDQPMLSE